MNNYSDSFHNLQQAMSQINKINEQVYQSTQSVANQMIAPAQVIQNHIESIGAAANSSAQQITMLQKKLQNALSNLPITELANIVMSHQEHLKPFISNLNKIANSISVTELSKLDLTFLDGVNVEDSLDDEQPLTNEMQDYIQQEIAMQIESIPSNSATEWQAFIMNLYRKLPKSLFLAIICFIFSPVIEYVAEDPRVYMQELWEDATGIDMSGEKVAMIRTTTYLRAGRSKHSPLVLQEALQEAQAVIRITRKGNWVKISVLVNGETYTGWVEKSKVIQN